MDAATDSARAEERTAVVVIGSANLDIVTNVDRIALPGQTVLGHSLSEVPGGKGLNQAVAVVRSGAVCALIGTVGDDPAGQALRELLTRAGVSVDHLAESTVRTGHAFVQVDDSGENSIVVVPMANAELTELQVRTGLETLRPHVVLAQLEVPFTAIDAAITWVRVHGGRFILNASPSVEMDDDTLAACDPVVVNVAEARALLGGSDASPDVLAEQLAQVSHSAVVTDGPRGAAVADATGVRIVSGLAVSVVDTTGAGDEFAGALAAGFYRGLDIYSAVQAANAAAARAVALPRHRRVRELPTGAATE